MVELPDGERVTTPGSVALLWKPYNRQIVRVTATGYRPLEVDLRRNEVKFGRFIGRAFRRGDRGEVEFVLVPTHGPTGTWTEGDIPD